MRSDRRVWGMIYLLVFTGAASCDDPVADVPPPDRSFTLATFEGMDVPWTFLETEGAKAEVLSGSFLLAGDGSCEEAIHFRFTHGTEVVDTDVTAEGVWTQVGDSLTFTWANLPQATGRIVDGRLRVVQPSGVICVRAPCPSDWLTVFVPSAQP